MPEYSSQYEAVKAAKEDANRATLHRIVRWAIVGLIVLILLIAVGAWANPQYKLYKAETEKKAIIAEARAQSDAAVYRAERRLEEARAERSAREEEAKGISNAQATISESLTPEYLQWFFIETLSKIKGQIVYVPTEGNMPITEAGRTP